MFIYDVIFITIIGGLVYSKKIKTLNMYIKPICPLKTDFALIFFDNYIDSFFMHFLITHRNELSKGKTNLKSGMHGIIRNTCNDYISLSKLCILYDIIRF